MNHTILMLLSIVVTRTTVPLVVDFCQLAPATLGSNKYHCIFSI